MKSVAPRSCLVLNLCRAVSSEQMILGNWYKGLDSIYGICKLAYWLKLHGFLVAFHNFRTAAMGPEEMIKTQPYRVIPCLKVSTVSPMSCTIKNSPARNTEIVPNAG